METILGIDPGSRRLGLCLLEVSSGANSSTSSCSTGLRLLHLETLRVEREPNFFKRLWMIAAHLDQLLKNFKPTYISLEGLIYVKSPTALMKLAQVRGAMLATFGSSYENRIFEYSPNLIKQTVTGFGHADKEAIQKMLKLRFPQFEDVHFETNDASDALMIALCHYLQHNLHLGHHQRNLLPPVGAASPRKVNSKKMGRGLAASVAHALNSQP